MGSGNYESQILEAIQILVDNAVSKANYDKTIQGTISRCVDATIGKYIVKYQDSSFYAYSHNTETKYTAGTGVYILVPGNDMSKEKSIIGTVEHLGPDYVSIIEGENGYEVTGVNTVNTDGTFGLCSYKNEDMKILYDRDNSVDLLGLDVFGLENYIKQSNSIICGATFKTALDSAQKYRGDYGIVFHLDFIDKSTGETVTKSYIVNVDQMTGNPYNYTVASRQYGIFDVDGANFISVKQVYIFAYDFPNAIEGKENDIFVSKVELSAANALEKEAAATCALTFVTPQGTYFDENDLDSDTRTLQAQIRIKGEAIDNDSQNIEYYWFRENNNISPKSEKYNQYGGTGWECLNAYSVIQAETADSEAVVQWTHGDYQYVTKKENNVARETTYKCVAVYTDGTILSKTIVIYNYSSNYEITIQSDSGVAFNYDVGKPTLTCLVNGKEENSDTYKYVWSVINSSNQLSILEETTVNNDDYNTAVAAKAALLEKIEAEQLITAADQEALQVYTQTIDQYEYIMRVEKNKIHNLKISSITKFSTYKCSVYKSGVAIGTASIIITNTQEKDVDYTLVVENGNQVFKYNEKGISPASQSNDKPITILPLSFTLYDDKGQRINHNVIDEIEWKVAKTDTMLNIALSHGNGTENADGTLSYYNDPELSFSINPAYDVKKDKNEIQLVIKYNDKVISAKTNFTFVKEGEASTNGTDFICKIVPNGIEGDIVPRYPVVTYNNHTAQYSLNYTPKKADTWFKVQLWHDGELIFEGTQTGKTAEDQVANIKWSMLQNDYGNKNKDESNFTINSDTAAITFNTEDLESPANIVKVVVNYNNVDYYATLPITIVKVKNEDYNVQIPDNTGFRHVMYTTDGRSPAYDNQPFELIVSQIVEGVKNDISNFSSSEFAVDYDWNVCGKVYYSQWQSESNLITNTYLKTEKRNQKIFKPVDTYNGLCVNNAIICNITRGTEQIAFVHIPVHFYINRYGNAAINGWDGNSISLDEQGGIILSPQVGAGKKNEDNSFTGVFMGSVKEPGAEQEEHGLFGYNAGQRTISLNSEDGSARFGKTGAGQIIIDPTTGAAQLKSGNYIPAKKDAGGNIIEPGSGMLIDLTEPTIDFGTGGFRVDKDGQVHALGYATVNDLSKAKEEIEESVTIFDVITNTSSLAIPVNTSNKPLYNTTYSVSYQGMFKGKPLDYVNIFNSNEPIDGISVDISELGKIKFTVNVDTPIQNLINDFTFKFSYSIDGKLYETSKQISLALAAQGADGKPGEDGKDGGPGAEGKSAYQIWLEAGNTGSEEDYLNSLKGADGEKGQDGEAGKSAYQLWLEAGNTGTETEYLESLKGKDGEDGQPGKDGQDGEAGKSAYQLWLDAGNTGTEEDYLNSLKGKDGEDGKEGPQGPQGEPGKDGQDGEKGDTGIGVKQITEQYYLSTSNIDQTGGSWKTTQDPWTSGKYIWTRSEITWTDNSITYTIPVLAEAINTANTIASTANEVADQAASTASTASSTAAEAKTTAEGASTIAGQAKADAALATSTAQDASAAADAATKEAADALKEALEAAKEAEAAQKGLNSLTEVVTNNYNELQNQIDGAISTWFDNYVPTLTNKPASDWTTEELKNQHLGDLFYIVNNATNEGKCYRFALVNNTYQWVLVADADVAKALSDAAKAQASADGKATVFTGTTIPTGAQEGDIWMKSANDGILTYVNGAWVEYNKYTDNTLATEAKDLADEAKGESTKAMEDALKALEDAAQAKADVLNTVAEVDVEYYVADSEDETPSSTSNKWSSDAPQWSAGKFIWSRQKITLVDKTQPVQYSEPARVTGATGGEGPQGPAGPAAKSVSLVADAEIFKSTTGADGIFTPDTITITPIFQDLTYNSWQYYGVSGATGDSGEGEQTKAWIAIGNDMNGLTINSTSHALTISKDCALYNKDRTSITFKCLTNDNKYYGTITISKLYDTVELEVIVSTKDFYTNTDTLDMPIGEDIIWTETQTLEQNKYMWERTAIYYSNSDEPTYTTPICLNPVAKFVVGSKLEYNQSLSTDESSLDNSKWDNVKPIWNSQSYLWTRTVTIWSDGTETYSDPICDTDSQSLQESISQNAKEVMKNELASTGVVRLMGNKLVAMDSTVEVTTTENGIPVTGARNFLYLNEQGIVFGHKEPTQTFEETPEENFTAVWSLDGTFNAQGIEVLNLNATNIQNGTLRLYDRPEKDLDDSTKHDGKVLIFKGDPPADITETIYEADKNAIVTLSADMFEIKLSNGGSFRVKTDGGLEIVEPDGKTIVCNMSNDGRTLQITRTKIIESIDFGNSLRGLVMERTENGITHKGIGFTKI